MKMELIGKITFADVNVGEVFVSCGGYVCMKICKVEFKPGRSANCVYLDDGSLGFYEENDCIVRIIKNVTLREEE